MIEDLKALIEKFRSESQRDHAACNSIAVNSPFRDRFSASARIWDDAADRLEAVVKKYA